MPEGPATHLSLNLPSTMYKSGFLVGNNTSRRCTLLRSIYLPRSQLILDKWATLDSHQSRSVLQLPIWMGANNVRQTGLISTPKGKRDWGYSRTSESSYFALSIHLFQVLIKFLLQAGPELGSLGLSEEIQDMSTTLKEITVDWRRQDMKSS